MEKLTDSQNHILQVLKKLIAKNGYPPTVREIGEAANLSSPATIHFHLKKLEEKGYIRKGNSKNRTIELLVPNEYKKWHQDVINVPLIESSINTNPIDAIESSNEVFPLPMSLVPSKNATFAFKVNDDSMINIGIYKSDILIVQKTSTAKNGDIVITITNSNELVVKKYYKEEKNYRLESANDSIGPIILKRVAILGKVVSLYRKI